MALAIQRVGTTRFRYDIGVADVPVGTVKLQFAAGAFKNADSKAADGTTVTGAGNAATDVSFKVTTAAGTIASPGPNASVDVHTLNGRSWIDVTFVAPALWPIDVASILDLAPEFVLGGAGLGTARLDASQAPTRLGSTLTFRYWLLGRFAAAGDVTVTYLPDSWSFSLSRTDTLAAVVVAALGTGTPPSTLTITIPPTTVAGWTGDFVVDPASVLAGAWLGALTFVADNGWTVVVDLTRSVLQGASANQFVIPVTVTRSGATDNSATTTITPHLTSAPLSHTASAVDGSPPNSPPETVPVPQRQASYIDVRLTAGVGNTLNLGLLGDQITFGGFGGTGVTVITGAPMAMGNDVYRFLLQGTFRPGQVVVTFHLDKFGVAGARAPPAGETDTNAFLVTGSTGDVTSTIPSTPTTPEKTIGLSGAAIGRDLINGRHYIEITFRPSDGFSLDNATIDGGEIQLRDASGALIALAAPVRVGLTNTYRYAFVTDLGVGRYTILFVAGSFGDTGGTLNLAETEEFTVATPIAALADPIRGQVIDAKDFNGRGYVDITFAAFHEQRRRRRHDHRLRRRDHHHRRRHGAHRARHPAPRQRLHLPLLLHRARLRRPRRLVHRRQLGQHRWRHVELAVADDRERGVRGVPGAQRRGRRHRGHDQAAHLVRRHASRRSPAPRWMPRVSSAAPRPHGPPPASSP